MNGHCCFSSPSVRLPLSSSSSSSTTTSAHTNRPAPLSSRQILNRPPLSPPPSVGIFSSLLPRRHRRQNHRRASTTTPSRPHFSPPSTHRTAGESESNISISIDIDRALSKASTSLRRFYDDLTSSGSDAFDDLRSSVSVEEGFRRIGFSCRKSSLVFVANAVFSCLVAVVSARVAVWLYGLLISPFWRGGGSVVKRDRSLGGREVVVGRRSNGVWESGTQVNPLSTGKLEGVRGRGAISREKRKIRKDRIPTWWPTRVSQQASLDSFYDVGNEDSQRQASMLVRAMMHNRMNGRDFQEDDIIQLRRICRSSGTQPIKVHFDTTNARDNFFRASISFALKVVSRAGQYVNNIQIDGEDIRQFLAGLAHNIGLEDVNAVVLLSAAVASKTRSCFLQALALEVQGRRSEALEELSVISRIHQTFPPEDESPEIEMVANVLRKNMKLEQRKHLLNLLEEVSNAEGQRIAAIALGLHVPRKN